MRQRLAVGVAGGQHVGAELAAQGAAADAGDAVVAGFFRQKIDDLERVLDVYKRQMPPRGGTAADEASLRAAVAYMMAAAR